MATLKTGESSCMLIAAAIEDGATSIEDVIGALEDGSWLAAKEVDHDVVEHARWRMGICKMYNFTLGTAKDWAEKWEKAERSAAIATELTFIAESLSETLGFPVEYYPGSSDRLYFFGPSEPSEELNRHLSFLASETAEGLLAIAGAYLKGRRDAITTEILRGNMGAKAAPG